VSDKMSLEEAAEKAKKLATRSGAKSTEFWAVAAAAVAGVVMSVFRIGAEHWAVQIISNWLPLVGTLVYAAFRGRLKKVALDVLPMLVEKLKEKEESGES